MEEMICRKAKSSVVQNERLHEQEKMHVMIVKMVKKMMMNCYV